MAIVRQKIYSSSILSAGWLAGTLELEFCSGAVYRYFQVPERLWREFRAVPSKGVYFAQFVRGKYEYQCTIAPNRREDSEEKKPEKASKPAKRGKARGI